MSLVSDFATAAAGSAMPMIGREPVVLIGSTIQCVLAETDNSKEYEEGGFEVSTTLSAVCLSADVPSGVLLKKKATARGLSFRVEGISVGVTFTTFTLEEIQKA